MELTKHATERMQQRGIPRLINQVCDHAMVMASLGGYHQLDAAGIEEAWADLQQLPGPWNDLAAQSNDAGDSIVDGINYEVPP